MSPKTRRRRASPARRPAGKRNVRVGAAFTGRANLYAQTAGLVLIDAGADRCRQCAATKPSPWRPCRLSPKSRRDRCWPRSRSFPLPRREASVAEAEKRLRGDDPLIRVAPFQPRQAALISTRLPGMKPALLDKNREALDARLKPLGSAIMFERRVPHETGAVAEAIAAAAAPGPIPFFCSAPAPSPTGATCCRPRWSGRAAMIARPGHAGRSRQPADGGNVGGADRDRACPAAPARPS